MCNERPWWKRPLRVIQTNLQVLDTPRMDEARIAAQIEDLGANVLVVNVGGIYAWYPTALPFTRSIPACPRTTTSWRRSLPPATRAASASSRGSTFPRPATAPTRCGPSGSRAARTARPRSWAPCGRGTGTCSTPPASIPATAMRSLPRPRCARRWAGTTWTACSSTRPTRPTAIARPARRSTSLSTARPCPRTRPSGTPAGEPLPLRQHRPAAQGHPRDAGRARHPLLRHRLGQPLRAPGHLRHDLRRAAGRALPRLEGDPPEL